MAQGRCSAGLARLGLARPEARAWALYDWANSAMVTTIVTAVFPIYYQSVAADGLDPDVAIARYAQATTLALAITAILAVPLGALADVRGRRKRYLCAFALLGMAATAAMFFIDRGEWRLALVCFVLANIGAAGSFTFYDALLPHVARPGEMDRLSTAGYALGYVGGGVMLALNLAWIERPAWFGLPHGEGLSSAQASLPARLSFLSVAVWWALFSIPLLRRVPEPLRVREEDESARSAPLRTAFLRLGETFRELKRYRHALLLLVAFLIYNDGISTIIRMAGITGADRGFSRGLLIGAILLVQFVGIPCAFAFGWLAERFGAKRMVLGALALYAVICFVAWRMDSETDFVVLAILVGLVQGGAQALSRSLFASMIPRHKSGEFFALFAVGEKFAGIFGPWLFAQVMVWSGSSQDAILSIAAFFVVGGFLLTRVDVAAGVRAARAADASTLPTE